MKVQDMILGSTMLILLAGCQHYSLVRDSMPTITRTGEVKDIIIHQDLQPATVTANPGDEIRWINKRQGDVRVIFLSPVTELMSCQRNFGDFIGTNKNEYAANLGPNETASVCFRSPTEIKYVVRAKSGDPSGEQSMAGVVNVEGAEQTSRTSSRETASERNERRAAQADQEHMSTR
ncbi:MAG TPA: hypothetical protein VFS39_12615 [Nitrospira sp.]|nr:hypothetical protein [Nitrospira sp.]